MVRLPVVAFVVLGFLVAGFPQISAQNSAPQQPRTSASTNAMPEPGQSPPVPANAPRISKQTRYAIIRDFETQLVYSRTTFPMGSKGLQLKEGAITPNGQALQQLIALWGPAIKPGDPTHITYVRIRDDHIHLELNGGPVHRKKWYQRIEVSGSAGVPMSPGSDESIQNPHGSYLDIYFAKYVPEMTAAQFRDVLLPALDFKAKSKEEAYLDTVPPKVREAIKAHHVLVGMNSEMVTYAMGKPPKKVRERDGETTYEEWIYGQPPQDVDFVRIVADEVVRVETMKVGGQKIVRTEKEVILPKPDKEEEAKKEQEERPPNAPSLRRPGEDPANVPKPAGGVNPIPPSAPPTTPQAPGDSGPDYAKAPR